LAQVTAAFKIEANCWPAQPDGGDQGQAEC